MTLFLHIGMPRAASTSIQNIIDNEQPTSVLKLVPGLGKRARKIKYFVNSFEEENKRVLRGLSIEDEGTYDEYKKKLWKKVQKSIDKSQDYFISEETLFYFSKDKILRLHSLLTSLFDEVVIISVLRSFDSFLHSSYRHRVGLTTYTSSFSRFKKTFMLNHPILDPFEQSSLWSELTGWEQRSLNLEVFNSENIVSHIEELLSIKISKTKQLRTNDSMSAKHLEIKLFINKMANEKKWQISDTEHKSLVEIFNKIDNG